MSDCPVDNVIVIYNCQTENELLFLNNLVKVFFLSLFTKLKKTVLIG